MGDPRVREPDDRLALDGDPLGNSRSRRAHDGEPQLGVVCHHPDAAVVGQHDDDLPGQLRPDDSPNRPVRPDRGASYARCSTAPRSIVEGARASTRARKWVPRDRHRSKGSRKRRLTERERRAVDAAGKGFTGALLPAARARAATLRAQARVAATTAVRLVAEKVDAGGATRGRWSDARADARHARLVRSAGATAAAAIADVTRGVRADSAVAEQLSRWTRRIAAALRGERLAVGVARDGFAPGAAESRCDKRERVNRKATHHGISSIPTASRRRRGFGRLPSRLRAPR